MKKIVVLFAVVALWSCQEKKEVMTFTPEALAQKVYDVDGKETTVGDAIAKHKGSKVVLDIWASWCKDCVASMPETEAVQAKYPDVKFIMISVDDEEQKWKYGIEKYVNPNHVKADQYFFNTGWKKAKNNEFIKFIKLDWIPRYLVLDENGKIINYYAKTVKEEAFIEAIQ